MDLTGHGRDYAQCGYKQIRGREHVKTTYFCDRHSWMARYWTLLFALCDYEGSPKEKPSCCLSSQYPKFWLSNDRMIAVFFRSHSQNSQSSTPATPHSYYQQHYYPNYQPFYNSAAAAWWAAYQQPNTGYYYGQYPDSSYAYSAQQYYDSSAYSVLSSFLQLFLCVIVSFVFLFKEQL